jgi:hypothetical protein
LKNIEEKYGFQNRFNEIVKIYKQQINIEMIANEVLDLSTKEKVLDKLSETTKVKGYETIKEDFYLRNNIVLGDIKSQLSSGVENIVIYYGAGHMPFIEEELVKIYNVTPLSIEWITALVY